MDLTAGTGVFAGAGVTGADIGVGALDVSDLFAGTGADIGVGALGASGLTSGVGTLYTAGVGLPGVTLSAAQPVQALLQNMPVILLTLARKLAELR